MAASMRNLACRKLPFISRCLITRANLRERLSRANNFCIILPTPEDSELSVQRRLIYLDNRRFTNKKNDDDAININDGTSISSSSSSCDESNKSEIELRARPKNRKQERQKFNEIKKSEQVIKQEKPFADKLLNAVDEVGKLSENPDKTVDELLSRLQSHALHSTDENAKISKQSSLGDLLSTMKLEPNDISDGKRSNQSDVTGSDLPTYHREVGETIYTGARMNIFHPDIMQQQQQESLTPLMDKLREEEMEMHMNFPPANAFQEMIKWTKEGKMWHFPINNEQDLDEEMKIPFTEHVFLDHLIDDFPKKGPIRHFIELVVVGLSKNPYLTVQEKHDQIQWFRDYFKDKMHLVEFVDNKQEQISHS